MSDNFLSFISKVDAKPTDASALVNADPSQKVAQGTEFTSILEKEQAKTQGAKRADEMAGQDAEPAVKLINVDEILQLPINPDAPVTLPIGAASGNPLPELSIHSASLKVGRVILTTANPKVSEASLSQFARSQGADVPGLMAVASDETTPPMPQTPNTQNILHGLMGGLSSSPGQSPTTPVGMGPGVLAANPPVDPKAALDDRLPFVQQTEISAADKANSRNVLPAVGLPLNKSVNASPTPQSIADLNSAAAKGAARQGGTADVKREPPAQAGHE